MTICTLVKQKPLRQPRMTNFTKFHKQAVHKAKNKEVWDLDPSTDFLFNKKYRMVLSYPPLRTHMLDIQMQSNVGVGEAIRETRCGNLLQATTEWKLYK